MKRIVWIILLLMASLGTDASAQSRGSYFFGNSLLRSKLNPAFAPESNYASLPLVGSLSADFASNVGLKNFVFPEGDANYLFLNDIVPADTFLSELPSRDPYLQERVESDLFNFGMKIGSYGYATLSLSLVESGNITLSGDLLRFIKAGSSAVPGSFEGGSAELAAYTALSAGYAHDLSSLVEGLQAGLRIKLLSGLAAGRFSIDHLGMQLSPERISAGVHGSGSLSGIGYSPNEGFSLSRLGNCSIGMAADIGVSYRRPMDGPWTVCGIELSASVCDLGGIRYSHDLSSLLLDNQFSFQGIGDLAGEGESEGGFEQVIDDLTDLTKITSSAGEPFYYPLPASIHVGASAQLWQGKAHAGLLYYHAVHRSNVMIAGGVSPLEWLNLGVNWTFIGPANRLGFYAEFIPKKYIGLFLGMERASLRSNSNHIPIRNFTQSIAFGVNVLFGD